MSRLTFHLFLKPNTQLKNSQWPEEDCGRETFLQILCFTEHCHFLKLSVSGKLVIFLFGLPFQGQYLYCKIDKLSVSFLMKICKHNVISSLPTCMVLVCLPHIYHVVNKAQLKKKKILTFPTFTLVRILHRPASENLYMRKFPYFELPLAQNQ